MFTAEEIAPMTNEETLAAYAVVKKMSRADVIKQAEALGFKNLDTYFEEGALLADLKFDILGQMSVLNIDYRAAQRA